MTLTATVTQLAGMLHMVPHPAAQPHGPHRGPWRNKVAGSQEGEHPRYLSISASLHPGGLTQCLGYSQHAVNTCGMTKSDNLPSDCTYVMKVGPCVWTHPLLTWTFRRWRRTSRPAVTVSCCYCHSPCAHNELDRSFESLNLPSIKPGGTRLGLGYS